MKEKVQAIVSTFPFEYYPNSLIVEVVYNAIFWLNCFLHKNGVHAILTSHTIINRSTIDYNEHCTQKPIQASIYNTNTRRKY